MHSIARRCCLVAVALFGAALPIALQAQTATQTVTFAVSAINQVAFAGSPSLTITTAVAGSAPTSVTNATATWAVTTNQSTAKITASIPTAMPAGLTLSVNLVAPAGATSAGFKTLAVAAVDLVTSVTKVAQGGMTATYKLDATAAAGVVTSSTRVVTYTITGGV
ncbi:MAG: hypothetical protein ABI625_07495 [bacterium]